MKTKSLILSISLVFLSNLNAEDLILSDESVTMFGDYTYDVVWLTNSTINVDPYTGYDDGRGFLRLYADSIIIDQNSAINADGAARSYDNSNPGSYNGAGYGGQGGGSGSPTGGSTYGENTVLDMGSRGGGDQPTEVSCSGGGAILLDANYIQIDGEISANGNTGSGGSCSGTCGDNGNGGGSGGHVILIGNNVINTGIIRTNGGTGGTALSTHSNYSAKGGGGGGGGRIYISSALLENNGMLTALGGAGGSGAGVSGGDGYYGQDGEIQIETILNWITSTSHPDESLWYLNPEPTFTMDAGENIYGYYYEVDQDSSGMADPTSNLTLENMVTLNPMDEGTWYFHGLPVDNDFTSIDSLALTFQFNMRTSAVGITSPTHPDNEEYYDNSNILFNLEELPGIDDYYYIFDQDSSTVPTDTSGSYLSSNSLILPNIPEGTYWLHVVAVDNVGFIGQNISHYQINIGSQPLPDEITLYATSAEIFPGDTFTIGIIAAIPESEDITSFNISLNLCPSIVEFTGITIGQTINDLEWISEINQDSCAVLFGAAGSNSLEGQVTLLEIDIAVPWDAEADTQIVAITSAMFNEDTTQITIQDGIIEIILISPDYGDVSLNGNVTAYDASLILQYLVELIDLEPQQSINADVTLDNTISGLDASIILQYSVELVDSLPYSDTTAFFASGDISMNDDIVEPGQLIEIPLHLTNGNNIYSFEGRISFNPEHLTYDEILWSNLVNHFTIEVNQENGEIMAAGAGTIPDGEEGEFATLLFTVNNNFDADATTVTVQNLRWNEEPVMMDVASATLSSPLAIDKFDIPIKYSLSQAYPNPFNPVTTLRYDLPEQANVNIIIYDLLGREVRTLVNSTQDAGFKSVIWNATNDYGKPVSAGVYLYQIRAGEFVQTKKMVLLK